MEKKKKDQKGNKTVYEEDISYSESLDIYRVKLYEDETWSCTCPYWRTIKKECVHIKQYKKYYFDPAFITDNADCYRRFEDFKLFLMGKESMNKNLFLSESMRNSFWRWFLSAYLREDIYPLM